MCTSLHSASSPLGQLKGRRVGTVYVCVCERTRCNACWREHAHSSCLSWLNPPPEWLLNWRIDSGGCNPHIRNLGDGLLQSGLPLRAVHQRCWSALGERFVASLKAHSSALRRSNAHRGICGRNLLWFSRCRGFPTMLRSPLPGTSDRNNAELGERRTATIQITITTYSYHI